MMPSAPTTAWYGNRSVATSPSDPRTPLSWRRSSNRRPATPTIRHSTVTPQKMPKATNGYTAARTTNGTPSARTVPHRRL
jgi:hypothetical protein